MYTRTLWIIGAEGHIGSCILKSMKKDQNFRVIGTDKDVDITNMEELEKAASIYKPTVIINCAAISDPDYCQEHRIEAYKVNTLGARNVAIVSRQQNARLIHMSTDDVFCGIHDRAKHEFDIPTPENVYGMSKLAGENFVRELNPKHLIIRSSWVYGIQDDYFDFVVEKGKNNEPFVASVDKLSSPTSIHELIKCLKLLIDSDEYGIIHASCEGVCSRYEFASTILRSMGYDPKLVQASFASQTVSRTSTVLENLMLKITGIYELPHWTDALNTYVEKRKKKGAAKAAKK